MSRLKTIEPNEATGATKQLLDAVNDKFGMVPNLARTLANSPAALQGYLAFGEALANPGVEQDEFAAHLEQQTIAGEINAIFRVWRAFFLPQSFGYNAEHRAPIEAEPPALKV